ncbi:MAG: carboxypeptidase regulatory-like domain-containing protein [Bryobacteraceae bacterium]|jgi:hypothetical protein
MKPTLPRARFVFGIALLCAVLHAQVAMTGRVVDETGAAVEGARIELRPAAGPIVSAPSDPAGNFSLTLPAAGEYAIRAERQGFYVYQGPARRFEEGPSQLTIALNHLQEFSERVDVTVSPAVIDPQQAAAHKEIDGRQALTVPFPAPQDYRNALPLVNGVVQDNAGHTHVNGADAGQTSYALDGFNISDPVTGRLEARVNIETIQSVDLETSRFSADTGRGSAGAVDVRTKMGDDHWRFGGTNFIPGVSFEDGLHVDKWTPRLEISGPLARGRAWFHNGFDAFYNQDIVHGLPNGQNRTRGISASDLARFQVNLAPSNILTGSFLANLADNKRNGLTILNPAEATSTRRQTLFMTTVRDQQYFGGALLDAGFADTRTRLHNEPQGDLLYQITPFGNRGNYFEDMDRHAYRQQATANLFLPTFRLHGEHQFKFGIDFEREAFHQTIARHDYEVVRDDGSVARLVSFAGGPFQAHKNFEDAQYVQDRWTPGEGVTIETGLRAEWNEVVRDLELAPRLAAVWAPRRLEDTKFSAGWGVYYDAIGLALLANQQDQTSLSTFYSPAGDVQGSVSAVFRVNDRSLVTPKYQTASAGVERKLPKAFYLKANYVRRSGSLGLVFVPEDPAAVLAASGSVIYDLRNARRSVYDGLDVSLHRTFAGQYEWFAGYTRSSSRTNAAIDYSLENPVFAPQAPGKYPWDTPNRFHMWGWLPLPNRALPSRLRFATRNTTVVYLVEYRTGFPFSVVDERSFQIGAPGSMRFPDYFNINLQLERKFQALRYLWAWRFGFDNLTNNGNPNTVNNVVGTPQFLTYGRGQVRAFAVRLRMLGRK